MPAAPRRRRCRKWPSSGLDALREGGRLAPDIDFKTYQDRLAYELDMIEKMGFSGYFLIVADFIQWAKDNGIPVGPGRGSGAGSLVAWSLKITDLDPLRWGLLFERFLNPERVSMPDFDIDFCQDKRDRVIRYVRDEYGHDRVAAIITFGKLQARAVLRDVGRVLGMPYGQVDRICKLVPNNPAKPVTLAQALESEQLLKEQYGADEEIKRLIDLALQLEGLYRNASTHAAGVVIGDRPLDQLVPLYRDTDNKESLPATQFNMKWVETAGLVKFDFLGLKTLTVIEKAVEQIGRDKIDIAKIPLDDEATFKMLAKGDAYRGLPDGRQRHARHPGQAQAQPLRGPDRAGGALSARPDGRHPDLYQASSMARRSPTTCIRSLEGHPGGDLRHHGLPGAGDADRPGAVGLFAGRRRPAAPRHGQEDPVGDGRPARELRRRRGQEQRRGGAGLEIFDQVAKFAGYGFNKCHSAAYALVAYQTAYLKANYPVEFFAATMTLDMGNADKIGNFRRELERLQHRAAAARRQQVDGGVRRRDDARRQEGRPLRAGGASRASVATP